MPPTDWIAIKIIKVYGWLQVQRQVKCLRWPCRTWIFQRPARGGFISTRGSIQSPANYNPITAVQLPKSTQSFGNTKRRLFSGDGYFSSCCIVPHRATKQKRENGQRRPTNYRRRLESFRNKKKKKRTKWKWARKCVGHHQATHTRGATKVEIVADKNCTNARCSVSRHGSTLCTEQVNQILTPTD